jgi:pilus assembly protein CpaB
MKPENAPGARVVRKIRVRALLFLVLALAAGTGAVFLAKRYMDRARRLSAATSVQTAKIVVAAMDIPIATEITEPQVELAPWPASHLPAGSFVKVEEVVGRTTQQNLLKGEPVLGGRLAAEDRGRGLAALLERGMRAVTVKVNQVVGVAGFVQPGDFVDVVTTMRTDEETQRDLKTKARAIAKVILQNIKVLAVGEHMVTKGSKPVKVQVVTLEVTPPQSERIALASQQGVLQLTMRSRIDQEHVPTAGMTPMALLAPDEGAEQGKPQVAQVAPKPQPRRRPRRRAEAPKKPDSPVVEVLRGQRVERRELLPTADSKKQ